MGGLGWLNVKIELDDKIVFVCIQVTLSVSLSLSLVILMFCVLGIEEQISSCCVC